MRLDGHEVGLVTSNPCAPPAGAGEGRPPRVRPHSPSMLKQLRVDEEEADGTPTGKTFDCFNSSTFKLPGGDADDVKRVFEATFGIELPNFDQQVGHFCRVD